MGFFKRLLFSEFGQFGARWALLWAFLKQSNLDIWESLALGGHIGGLEPNTPNSLNNIVLKKPTKVPT